MEDRPEHFKHRGPTAATDRLCPECGSARVIEHPTDGRWDCVDCRAHFRDPAAAKQPSLDELKARERRDAMEGFRPHIEAGARRFGIAFDETTDIFDLARAVHEQEDELRRPELERRAQRLGVATHTGIGPFRKPRRITDISLDCYREEDRRALLKRYGYA